MLPIALVTFLLTMLTPATPPATEARPKHLIEFGWDEPTPAFMREHVEQMERTPFDGCVYHIQYASPDGKLTNFMNACWGQRAFTDAELQNAVDDLRATPFRRFAHNFLRFNVLPGDVDWFDDFSAVENNARQAARIARLGQSAGVLFDIEQYQTQLFHYLKQRDAETKPWDAYAQQAHTRGQQLMRAFQQGWSQGAGVPPPRPFADSPTRPFDPRRPLTIFLTFGLSLPYKQCGGDRAKLPDAEYGLLAPLLEGMYAAADDDTVVVDGFEFAYGHKDEKQFAAARDLVTHQLPRFTPDPTRYTKHTSLAFGLWLDYDWRKHPYDPADPSKNYFPPKAFAASLQHAFRHADRYVWIYTETPRWWTDAGQPEKLPAAYDQAIRSIPRTP